jgi:hypothetical protein
VFSMIDQWLENQDVGDVGARVYKRYMHSALMARE